MNATEFPPPAAHRPELGRLFQRAARTYSDRILAQLAAQGYVGLTLFHTALIANLDPHGTRITVLAERAGMTKQAMGQLAAELEQRHYVERIRDPQDQRAFLIQFTAAGTQLLRDSYAAKHVVEAEYVRLLGGDGMEQLHRLLHTLVEEMA